jgi:hypothetical protein
VFDFVNPMIAFGRLIDRDQLDELVRDQFLDLKLLEAVAISLSGLVPNHPPGQYPPALSLLVLLI